MAPKPQIFTIPLLAVLCLFGTASSAYSQTGRNRGDTVRVSRYRASATSDQAFTDLGTSIPGNLRNPENITQSATYNEADHNYSVGTKLGDNYLDVPILMTPEEYNKWSMNKSMQAYFKKKNEVEYESSGKEKFDFTDMHFNLGPAEKIFGPGGVQVKTSGSASIKIGGDFKNVDNPSLSANNRKTFGFDFDEQINLNVNARVGDKINMDLNYNTEATFTFDTKNIKLRYEGKEDEIIKLLDAGNISFPTNSSLIQGASSLFGIRADLQFGKLSLQTVISRKESSSKTVSSNGGEQLTDFEIDASDYEENRHFFLAHYFRNNYDDNMSMLPTIMSGINITRIEVWVTNKRSSYDNPRNILAFTDIGESSFISNPLWHAIGGPNPSNEANDLYQSMTDLYGAARNADSIAIVLGDIISGSTDYEKISNARKLNESEYTLNNALGYLSLRTALSSDEVLAVAFEYTFQGATYQVGEFSSDIPDSRQTLYLKLLKSNSNSPGSGTWDLMMKNIYSIGSGSLSRNGFKLKILYASDSTGSRITYLPEQDLKSRTLLSMMNLDRLDENQKAHPNGQFDYVEGYTVLSSSGRIIFPVTEPFGKHLAKEIGDSAIASKYIFDELYRMTKTEARRIAEKDKFYLSGQFPGSADNVINLGSFNIPRGSVIVTAGGATLVENTDYIVDYSNGTVTIINQNIIDAGTSVNVSLESNTDFSMQRKTMLGLNWKYDFSKNFVLGGTVMHLNEMPLTTKVLMGSEPLVNTMLGLNLSWKKESQGLTNLIDLLPFVNATEPSRISLTAEVAHLFSSVSGQVQGNASYIDDFEAAESGIDISNPSAWSLSSIPSKILDRYAGNTDDIAIGYHRALLNWFTIDPLFTRRNSILTPAHLKSDLDQLSNHYVREVYERELFPNKETTSQEATTLSILNLSYYPNERGPYNLTDNLTRDGYLMDPGSSWGGIMRSLNTTDFEAANIEYLEFWLLDPFIYNPESEGGDFYINLGEVSEDILRDGKKFFENGMPVDGDSAKYTTTVWGRVPNSTSLVYAFDNNNSDSRSKQDVGYNGLSSEEERRFPTYADYLERIRTVVTDTARYRLFLNDPAADNYHYYRGDDYDDIELSVLERYKLFNGTEGNSPNSAETRQSYNTSARTSPDVEDVNTDYTLDEYEKYFSYHISLRPSDMEVGKNFIFDKREARIKLRNDKTETVNWYCFRIPLDQYETPVTGSIRDFSSIRFIRMYMTGFKEETHLRFGTLQLMTSQWRLYQQAISNPSVRSARLSGTVSAASINIEENGDRKPVNYVMPPGITRILDPDQTQLVQANEQAMSIKVQDVEAGDAKGIYKKSSLDLRKYQKIQMFAHAESLIEDPVGIKNDEVSVFVRLGSDYSDNYYEYEIPLKVTEPGFYNGDNESSREAVWPQANMLDITFDKLTEVKDKRNRERNTTGSRVVSSTAYTDYDPDNPRNRISVVGNPSIGNVRAIMIGVRNNSLGKRSAEVWVNELRLVGYESSGGTAAQGNLNVQLSDLGTFDMKGQMVTAGFGGLEQNVSERRTDNYYKYSITTSFNLGRFLPEKAKISIPVYYSYTREKTSPRYSPFDTDLELNDVIESYPEGHARDSIKSMTQTEMTQKNFSITGAKVNISSRKPMPYDPANFSVSFSRSAQYNNSSTIVYERDIRWRGALTYNYSSPIGSIAPFAKTNFRSVWFRILKESTINPLPQSISFNTDLMRNYHELQERDLEGSFGEIRPTHSNQFYWNRDLSVNWDIFKSLRMSFTARTRAEIEEPYRVVNKDLYPDDYEIWKDSVKMSLRKLGKPLDYQQNFTVNYQLPLDKLPIFAWTNTSISYTGHYTWNRGATYSSGKSYGNIISNKRNISLNGRFDMLKLYNMSNYLKKVNNRYTNSLNNQRQRSNGNNARIIAYNQEITLLPDSVYTIKHEQKTLRPTVSAITKDGTKYKLRYRRKDEDNISIRVKDTITLRLKIATNPKRVNRTDKITFDDVAQFSTRMLMMVRNFSFTYRDDYSLSLPGFLPNASLFGQSNTNGIMSPGLGFAFGFSNDSFIDEARNNGWLLNNDSVNYYATTNHARDLQIKMLVEPITDLRIDLNASWTRSDADKIHYMPAQMTHTRNGTFNMTTITLGSAFERHSADDGYYSEAFERFRNNLEVIRQRREDIYKGSTYPTGTKLAGQPYDPSNGGVNMYSADVMIPAFLATYTGRDANSASLSLFPSILSILPNWTVTYNGLSNLDAFKRLFKNFSIRSAYRSVYSVGSYNTFSSYHEFMDGNGFITDVKSGNPIPNSMYDIGTVAFNESFSPLIGINATLNNGITAKVEIRKTRVMSLSVTSIQMVETTSDDIVAGAGYKLTNVKILGARPGTGRNRISNDLNMNLDISYRNQSALCRNIALGSSQATSGNRAVKVSFTADYTYSKMITLNMYYDYQSNFPLVSTNAFPTSTHDFGFTIKFALTR